jgi:hypothetical protein
MTADTRRGFNAPRTSSAKLQPSPQPQEFSACEGDQVRVDQAGQRLQDAIDVSTGLRDEFFGVSGDTAPGLEDSGDPLWDARLLAERDVLDAAHELARQQELTAWGAAR